MRPRLRTYSIESEHSIVLSFFDGTSLRCHADELPRYLGAKELERVSKALLLRSRFIKRVLPPTAIVVMLAATLALGTYDYGRFQQFTLHRTLPPTSIGSQTPSASSDLTLPAGNPQLLSASAPDHGASAAIRASSTAVSVSEPSIVSSKAVDAGGANLVTASGLSQVKDTLRNPPALTAPLRHSEGKGKPTVAKKAKNQKSNN